MNEFDKPVVVIVPGDLHLTEPHLENVAVSRWVVDQANDLIQPDFVQFIGDNVQDATENQWQLFNEICGRLKVPHFAMIGDHDIKDDRQANGFRRHIGEPFGAMTLDGFRFLRLNTQESRPVGMLTAQIEWFRGEVDRAIARGERVVIFQHNYPYQIWEDFVGPGIDDWREVVQTRRIEAIVCGHTHYWQVANDGRNVLIATRSIGDPEGGPPGYTLLYFRGDDLAATYRSIEDRGPVVAVTHPRDKLFATGPRHVVSVSDRIVARVWSASAMTSVRYRIDRGSWAGLEPSDDGHWHGRLPSDTLPKGAHTIEVLALAADGTEGLNRVEFMVDRSGRYTAVPESRPMVHSTEFC
jgi:Icc protein